ncbi:hypothetical protein F7725_028976 [Dissostichus mawsoni]|uniref:Uncharacterized protein n=1 Tax=Dissostichus mawsoni TaxID=36200 RepID=A0A7J5XJP8_DISMA|nr:hypothetical protein F7725_028976 [Dissostichus mawsoni]
MMQFRMGYRSQDRVRLIVSAVPSIHPASLSAPVAAAAGGGSDGQGSRSSEHPAVAGGLAGKSTSSSGVKGNINWDCDSSLDQITVVRIDDTHIAEDEDSAVCYDMEYSIPAEEEANDEDEDDGVYVIEYSNPEEEGESYQFTMSVDRPLPTKKQIVTHAAARESVMSKPSRPQRLRQKGRGT